MIPRPNSTVRESGFSLVELMVVVLIVAILIAIAIPAFLGARTRAQARAAQSSLKNALTAAKTLYTDNDSYTPVTLATLEDSETSLDFIDGGTASSSPTEVSVEVVSDSTIVVAAEARSGMCYAIRDEQASGGGTTFYAAFSSGSCSAQSAESSSSWGGGW